jgi:LCP family protein required for cell wall assembly
MAADKNPAGQDTKSGPATPAAPNYLTAQRRFEQHITVNRVARRQRFLLVVLSAMSVVTLLVSGGAWLVTGYVSASLGRLDAGTSGTPASGPVNVLLVGVDTRGGLTRQQQLRLHVGNVAGANTDTMMLIHVPADRQSIQIVSLPRDSWVSIPGHGMNKINAAYGLGGPHLMVSTVEQATGLTINDYVEVDFVGFVRVIDELGGVNVCLPFAVNDSDSGLHLSAGPHHVDGVTALKFARDRHSFATSDLARIADQQQLVASLFAEATATGVLANPIRLQQVVSSITASVTVDRGFNATELASELRDIEPDSVTFTTVPIATPDYQTPTGEAAVLWNQDAAAALFHRLSTDSGLAPARQTANGAQGTGAAPAAPASPGAQHTAAQAACQ